MTTEYDGTVDPDGPATSRKTTKEGMMRLLCTCERGLSDPSSHFSDCPVRVWFEEQVLSPLDDPDFQGPLNDLLDEQDHP